MKGISPFIAVVLLIAFTVAIGGILSVWFSTITTSQTATVQSSSDALAKCSSTAISISDVRYNTSAAATPKMVNVTFSSSGNQNLKNVTITVTGGGSATVSRQYFNATGDDLLPGGVFATTVNTTAATIPPEQVIVNALCQSQYAISNVCKSGEPCMKPA